MFQTYLLAAGIDALSGIRKKALLEHCLGTEGQRILATLPTAVSEQQLVEAGGQQPQEDAEELLYRNVVNALDAHFGSHVTVVTERHRFRPRSQAQSETIRQFIAALRQLATRCKFGKLHDQMVRDQLIERTAVPAIRECLLLEKDVLRCVQAVEIAGQVEVAKHEALQLGETASDQTPTASAQMQATDIQRVHRKPKSAPRSTRAGTKAPKQTTKQTEFFGNCGLSGHKVGNQSCPPIGKESYRCHKLNHFGRCCRSSSSSSSSPSSTTSQARVRSVVNEITTCSRTGFKLCTHCGEPLPKDFD